MTTSSTTASEPDKRLPRTVWLLGWTSFFSDVSSEMVFPLLPLWLAGLGAGPTALGALEGLAEAVASALKYKSGQVSDRRKSHKPFVAAGYAIAAAMRPCMAITTAAWQVVVFRALDRVGKGIRTAPRDALLAASVGHDRLSAAFALQQGLDHAGALLGPLVATALLTQNWTLPAIFLLSVVPGAISVATSWLVDETPPAKLATVRQAATAAGDPPHAVAKLAKPVPTLLFVALAFFSLGKISDAFLLVRASELGVDKTAIPLLWAWLHLSKVAGSWLAGRIDRAHARRQLVAGGWAMNAIGILALSFLAAPEHIWLLSAAWGIVQGFFVPFERALIRQTALGDKLGTAYGIYHALSGTFALLCGLGVGALWEQTGVMIACTAAGLSCAIGAAVLSVAPLATPPRTKE